ncbi:MAG: asparaginase, partial [Firmicutes bacterium]|nr:asparaginase [Bacillota bacterium]
LALDDRLEPNVFVLKLTPGVRAEIFTSLLQMGYRGVVLEAFGLGGIPHLGRNLLPGIGKLLAEQIPVVATTQCLYDGVDLSVYDVGVKALETGLIPTFDMVTEAVITKFMWVLGHTRDLGKVREMMGKNYCGEIRGPGG